MVRIAGSHPADPGSSPGLGTSFARSRSRVSYPRYYFVILLNRALAYSDDAQRWIGILTIVCCLSWLHIFPLWISSHSLHSQHIQCASNFRRCLFDLLSHTWQTIFYSNPRYSCSFERRALYIHLCHYVSHIIYRLPIQLFTQWVHKAIRIQLRCCIGVKKQRICSALSCWITYSVLDSTRIP